MNLKIGILFSFLVIRPLAYGDTPPQPTATPAPAVPRPQTSPPASGQPGLQVPQTGTPGPQQPNDENADTMVMKKNDFVYDGADGRDPFKIYREIPVFSGPPPDVKPGGKPVETETTGISSAIVPNDITIVGILFKKEDPIVLVKVRGAKGIVKLRLNSRVGRNEGKVIDIQKDRMIIEQVRDFDGQKFTEKVQMKIREKKR